MAESQNCAHCGERLKAGPFSSNSQLSAQAVAAISFVESSGREHACNKCGDAAYQKASESIARQLRSLQREVYKHLSAIPILSIHSPAGWDYTPINLITAQTVTGTGLISEFASAWTDAFGAQSNSFSNKLKAGEDMCKASLQLQCARMGGNAILAADVDYGEVGGAKAMLMVCMTGSAVQVAEECLVADGRAEQRAKLKGSVERLKILEKFGIAPAPDYGFEN